MPISNKTVQDDIVIMIYNLCSIMALAAAVYRYCYPN